MAELSKNSSPRRADTASTDARYGTFEPDDSPRVAQYEPDIVPNDAVTLTEAPRVAAIILTRDSDSKIDHLLSSIRKQTYKNVKWYVANAGHPDNADELRAQISKLKTDASIDVLTTNAANWAELANNTAVLIDDSVFFLFLHDDIELGPGSIQALVEEAFRSNSAIVGPKVLDWDDPGIIHSVGLGVDKFGFDWPLAEKGERDQSQHDAAREVFYIQDTAMLIRSDIFSELDGFATQHSGHGAALDLCWRARVFGGRVGIMPAATVTHALTDGFCDDGEHAHRLSMRAQLQSALTTYSIPTLVSVFVQGVIVGAIDLIWSIVSGEFSAVGDRFAAIGWNLRSLRSTWIRRSATQKRRRVNDRDLRRQQVSGSAIFSQLARNTSDRESIRQRADSLNGAAPQPDDQSRASIGVWLVIGLFLLIGSRLFITNGIPVFREFVDVGSTMDQLAEWWNSWRATGLGSPSAAPSIVGVFGVLGLFDLGFDGVLRTLAIVGLVPCGAIAMWKLLGKAVGERTRLVGLAVFVANPLPYNALAEGRWQALVIYWITPVFLRHIVAAGGWEPFGDIVANRHRWSHIASGLQLGLWGSIAMLVAPSAVVFCVALALCVFAAVAMTSNLETTGLAHGATAVVVGVVAMIGVHLTWIWEIMSSSGRWSRLFGGIRSHVDYPTFFEALRFDTGVHGSVLVLGLWIGAVLSLLATRDHRFRWAVCSWLISAGSLSSFVLCARLADSRDLPSPELLLAPLCCAVALGIAMWVESFRFDVAAQSFGWRQVASVFAAVGVLFAIVIRLPSMINGRWDAPGGDIDTAFESISSTSEKHTRVLYIADADVLGGRGWDVDGDVSMTLTTGYDTTLTQLFPHAPRSGERALVDVLNFASSGQTTRLGALLKPFAIEYVVIQDRLAPLPYGTEVTEPLGALPTALSQQTDLRRTEVAPGILVYRNTEIASIRSTVDVDSFDDISTTFGSRVLLNPSVDFESVLPTQDGSDFVGPISSDRVAVIANNDSQRWRLDVEGEEIGGEPFGWQRSFEVDSGGEASLGISPNRWIHVGHLVQLAMLLTVLGGVWSNRSIVKSLSGARSVDDGNARVALRERFERLVSLGARRL